MLEEKKNGGAGGGGGVRIEDWSTPILSSLSPDEFNSISASDLVDQWSQLGVDDPLKTLKRLQVPIDDQGRLCINDVRHVIDAALREFAPIGPMALVAYKSELLYLTEVINQTKAEMQNYRDQCLNHEKRIELLIIDADDRQSNLMDEHKTEMTKTGKEAKEKYNKMYESKRSEIDYLEASLAELQLTLDENDAKTAEKELHFRRQVDENLAEIGDLRTELAELKTTLETGSPARRQSSDDEHVETSKSGFDFDTSMLVDEYEKCIRDMQDKIDEQNTTINSLIDQMDQRGAPEGEESKDDDNDEDDVEGHLVHFDKLTSTPNHKSSMADEIRSNGMIPKRLGQLLSDQQDRPSQTDSINMTDQTTQCAMRDKDLEDQIQDLMRQLESETEKTDNYRNIKAELESRIKEEEEKTKQVADDFDSVMRNNKKLETQLEMKANELQSVQAELNDTKCVMKTAIEENKTELDRFKLKFSQQEKLLEEKTCENAKQMKLISSLEKDRSHQIELNEQIRKLENQADQLERRRLNDTTLFEGDKAKFINDLATYFNINDLSSDADMSTVFKCLQSQLTQQKDNTRNDESLAQLSAEVDKLQVEIGKSKKLLRQKDAQIESMKKTPDLKETNEKLEKELKKYRLKLKTFESQLVKLNKVELEHQRELNMQKRDFVAKMEKLNDDKVYLEEQLRQQSEKKEREEKISAALATGLVTKVITEEITETTTTRLPRGPTQYLEVAFDSEEEKSSGDDCRLSYKLKSCSQDSGFDDQGQSSESWNGRIVYARDSNSLKYVDNKDISTMRASLGLTPTRQANQNKNNNHVSRSSSSPPPSNHELNRLRAENVAMGDKLAKMRVELVENTTRMRNLYQKLSKSELLLKDLYMENTRLMKVIRSHFAGSLPSV